MGGVKRLMSGGRDGKGSQDREGTLCPVPACKHKAPLPVVTCADDCLALIYYNQRDHTFPCSGAHRRHAPAEVLHEAVRRALECTHVGMGIGVCAGRGGGRGGGRDGMF